MDNIAQLIQQLSWPEITAVAVAFIIAFEKLALLTPTQTDNKIVSAAHKLFSVLGITIPDNTGKKEN